jgi:hypothetical protein
MEGVEADGSLWVCDCESGVDKLIFPFKSATAISLNGIDLSLQTPAGQMNQVFRLGDGGYIIGHIAGDIAFPDTITNDNPSTRTPSQIDLASFAGAEARIRVAKTTKQTPVSLRKISTSSSTSRWATCIKMRTASSPALAMMASLPSWKESPS